MGIREITAQLEKTRLKELENIGKTWNGAKKKLRDTEWDGERLQQSNAPQGTKRTQ